MRHSRTGKGPEQQGRGRDRACGVLCLCPPFRPELSLQAAAAGLVRTACAQGSQGLPTGAKSHARMAEPQPCPGPAKAEVSPRAGMGAVSLPCLATGRTWGQPASKTGRLTWPLFRWRHAGMEGQLCGPEALPSALPGRGPHAPFLSAAGSEDRDKRTVRKSAMLST